METTTRQTSIYTLRFTRSEHAAAFADAAEALALTISDRGDLSVSWRSQSATAATNVAEEILHAAGLDNVPATLTTGLGIHRRTVAEQG